ncbi:dedD protein [Thalassotalea sp. M1531]|uniref:DedD protein n=1 Tax=Thalassotalea algicola TaxID=2716224 RepID=A0A7Y0LBV1_9GAMM|nr:SPOR domain-containing protein [Thalassotalea algicola]NMP31257.1 dedD protein [Thalassotalea algicola]
MSTPFQNRLVGTIIVAAAVVIFLPDILDGEKESYQADFEAIPQAPAFEGSKEHKKFPTEKLKEIPQQTLSDETAADDLLVAQNADKEKDANALAKATPQETENVTKEPAAKPAAQKVDSTKVNKTQPAVSKDKYAWVIHLGSFKHQKNVDELMRKLKKGGYTAFTQPIKTKKGALTKVIVGPNLHKSDLEKKLSELKALTKVQGRIARFKVTK